MGAKIFDLVRKASWAAGLALWVLAAAEVVGNGTTWLLLALLVAPFLQVIRPIVVPDEYGTGNLFLGSRGCELLRRAAWAAWLIWLLPFVGLQHVLPGDAGLFVLAIGPLVETVQILYKDVTEDSSDKKRKKRVGQET